MTGKDPLDELVNALCRHYDPVERLAEAVCAAFADARRRDGGDQELHMRLMDVNAQARALRARAEARYGPIEGMYDRLAARGGVAARVWC